MNSQYEVLLVVGGMGGPEKTPGRWHFEPETVHVSEMIYLTIDMPFHSLVRLVKEKLRLLAPDIMVKLEYQFPEWMAIDDGNGSSPQYIVCGNAAQNKRGEPVHVSL